MGESAEEAFGAFVEVSEDGGADGAVFFHGLKMCAVGVSEDLERCFG